MSWHNNDGYPQHGYFFFILIRFLWALLPQSGYIFPDEFFQSPEIMARDLFLLNTTTTWEWNESFPTRSPVSAFLSSGMPYMVLKLLQYYNLIKMSSYLLLVFPRFYMTLISVLSFDIPVYILCRRLKLHPFIHLFVLSTSYVTLVFGTRPLSNVLETGILGILLVLLLPRNTMILTNNDKGQCEEMEPLISKWHCVLAGGFTALGLFCRQSFLLFAVTPYIGWLIWQFRMQKSLAKFIKVVTKILFMLFGFFLVSIFIILLDSWYFDHLQKGNIIFTFWNSIKYNAMQAHTHGHHPFFTHFLVNIPLLFGPIAAIFYSKLMSFCIWKNPLPNKDNKHKGELDYKYYWHLVLLLSIVVPVLGLSFIPHQEARFIMPVIIPLVLSFSQKIVGSKHSSTVLFSWCIWNLIGGLFFGVFHQGGVVPSLVNLENVIKKNIENLPSTFCHHIIYFHTYMPPNHLLVWPKDKSIDGHWLYMHDLGGSSEEILYKTKSKLKEYCDTNQSMVYVLCPGTIKIGVENQTNAMSFFPHLTMEDPPNFNQHLTQLIFGNAVYTDNKKDHTQLLKDGNIQKIKMYFQNLVHQIQQIETELSLNLYVLKF